MRPVEIAKKAMKNLNIEPCSKPIRGGTDGSLLTELGVPTPNLFTGMQNIRQTYSLACKTSMAL